MKYIKLFNNHSEYENILNDLILPNISVCLLQNEGKIQKEVHYNPYVDPYNGYDYIDLGLPSGTMWATMNIGALNETERGLFFAWGDTEGVYENGDKSKFTVNKYKFTHIDRDEQGRLLRRYCYKYNDNDKIAILELTDDPARANMGGQWRTPTKIEYDELFNNTSVEWITNYKNTNIKGYLLTSLINSNKIFFPLTSAIDKNSGISNSHIVLQMQTSERDPNEDEDYYYYLATINYNSSTDTYAVSTWSGENYRQYGINIRAVIKI